MIATVDTSAAAVERLAREHSLIRQTFGMTSTTHDMTAATLRTLLAERDAARAEAKRLREVVASADGAINAAYAQAHAEHAGHSTTESKCDAQISAWRRAAAALATDAGHE